MQAPEQTALVGIAPDYQAWFIYLLEWIFSINAFCNIFLLALKQSLPGIPSLH